MLLLSVVNGAVRLDHKAGSVAVKIHDQPVDNLLTPELQAAQPVRAQPLPKGRFGWCHVPSHVPRGPTLFRRMFSEDDTPPVYTVRFLIHGLVESLPGNPLPSGEGVASLSEPGVGPHG